MTEQTGIAPTTLAKKINVSPSTLTRPLAEGDDGTSTLHATTIDKIVAATGIAPPESAALALGRAPIGFREDAAPFELPPGGALSGVIRQLTQGRNGIDPWTIRTRALELEGFLPGDVVLVDLNAEPKPGDAVCAHIYEWPVMRANTVMRIFQRASPVKLLLSRSLDPAFAQPYVVDDDRVVVKGVILPHRLRPTS